MCFSENENEKSENNNYLIRPHPEILRAMAEERSAKQKALAAKEAAARKETNDQPPAVACQENEPSPVPALQETNEPPTTEDAEGAGPRASPYFRPY